MTTAIPAKPAAGGRKVVSREQWLAARVDLLKKEKEFTRRRDELTRERMGLPWVKVEKNYTFDTPCGKLSLADLFGDQSQLVVYHFMLAPGWKEGCVGCSFVADHIDATRAHLRARDVALVAVSRAPLAEIEAFQKRMGWAFPWASSFGATFNADFGVSFDERQRASKKAFYNYAEREVGEEMPGLSVFFKDSDGAIYHTYSMYERGLEDIVNTYRFLDLVPKGRDENGPKKSMGDWLRHHDRYGVPGEVDNSGRFRPAASAVSAESATCKCKGGEPCH